MAALFSQYQSTSKNLGLVLVGFGSFVVPAIRILFAFTFLGVARINCPLSRDDDEAVSQTMN